jgi:hypothetical protein
MILNLKTSAIYSGYCATTAALLFLELEAYLIGCVLSVSQRNQYLVLQLSAYYTNNTINI